MKIIATISACFMALSVAASGYASDPECKDDERLPQLHALLENPASINPPLELTAETFAGMDPEAAREFSPYLRICPGVTVAGGLPSRRLSADFSALLEQVGICYSNQDWDCVKRLKQIFIAKPLPVEATPSLLAQFRGKIDDRKSLAKALRMNITDGVVLYSDVFYALGGKITYNGQPIKSDYFAFLVERNPKRDPVQEIYDGYHGKIIYIYANCFYFTAIAKSLRKFGFIVHDTSQKSSNNCSITYDIAIMEAKKWLTEN